MPYDYNFANPRVKARKLTAAWRANHRLNVIAQRRGLEKPFNYVGTDHPDYPHPYRHIKNRAQRLSDVEHFAPLVNAAARVSRYIWKHKKSTKYELARQKRFERSHNRNLSLQKLRNEVKGAEWWKHPEAYSLDDYPGVDKASGIHTPPAHYWSGKSIPLLTSIPRPGKFPPKAYARRHAAAMDRLNRAHYAQKRWRFDYFTKHKKAI